MAEVQIKDKGAETPEKTPKFNEVREAIKNNDQAKLNALLSEDPVLRDRILNDPGKFMNEINTEAETVAEAAKPAESTDAETVAPAPKKKHKVEVEVDEDLLGTYGKNRTPAEAVLAALKGNKDKDSYIEELRGAKQKSESTAQAAIEKFNHTQAQLEEMKKKVTASGEKPNIPKKYEAKKLPPIPEPKDGDYLSEDYLKEKHAWDKVVAEENTRLSQYAEQLETQLSEISGSQASTAKKVEDALAEDETQSQVESHIEEIDKFRERQNEVFKSKRPVAKIESAFLDFLSGLAEAAGLENSSRVLTPDNKYRDDVWKTWEAYQDETKGKELREKCEARKVNLPEDFADLQTVYDIRAIQNQYGERDPATGQYKPWSLAKAFDHYQKQHIDLGKIKLEERAKGEKNFEQAVESGKTAAKEAPASAAANPIDLAKIPRAQLEMIARKKPKERNDAEKEILRAALKEESVPEKSIAEFLGE